MEFRELTVEEMARGYTFSKERREYSCIFCGETFSEGRIYDKDDRLITAEQAVREHVLEAHDGAFGGLINLERQVSGLTDVQLYNSEKNEFVMISSMNPLWSEDPDKPLTVADLDEAALQESIEWLCGKMKSTTDGINKVTTKQEWDGVTSKQENDCTNAANKIILVIPEDEGLKEKIESIIENANTRGIAIEVIPAYGNSTGSEEGASSEEGAGE